jgi:hypothetical protein
MREKSEWIAESGSRLAGKDDGLKLGSIIMFNVELEDTYELFGVHTRD